MVSHSVRCAAAFSVLCPTVTSPVCVNFCASAVLRTNDTQLTILTAYLVGALQVGQPQKLGRWATKHLSRNSGPYIWIFVTANPKLIAFFQLPIVYFVLRLSISVSLSAWRVFSSFLVDIAAGNAVYSWTCMTLYHSTIKKTMLYRGLR